MATGGTQSSWAGPWLLSRFRAQHAGPIVPHDRGPVLLFDADGDGNEDLLVTRGGNALPAGSPEYQPKLFLNDGRGGFRPKTKPEEPVNNVVHKRTKTPWKPEGSMDKAGRHWSIELSIGGYPDSRTKIQRKI